MKSLLCLFAHVYNKYVQNNQRTKYLETMTNRHGFAHNKISVPVWGLLLLAVFYTVKVNGQHHALNKNILFDDGRLFYKGAEIKLSPRAFYIDAGLTDREATKHPYVFKSVTEAVKQLKDGTEQEPMVLYIAPYVYWIDDPDDPEVRIPKKVGSPPFGMEIKCNWLKFFGLTDNAADVVLACNRGQTIGAKGNFTMFSIHGD